MLLLVVNMCTAGQSMVNAILGGLVQEALFRPGGLHECSIKRDHAHRPSAQMLAGGAQMTGKIVNVEHLLVVTLPEATIPDLCPSLQSTMALHTAYLPQGLGPKQLQGMPESFDHICSL